MPRLRNGLPGGSPLRIAARICSRDDPGTKDRSRLYTSKDSAQADAAPRLPLPEAAEAGLRSFAVPARQPAYPIRLQKRLRALDRAEGRFRAFAVDDDGPRCGDWATGRLGDGAAGRYRDLKSPGRPVAQSPSRPPPGFSFHRLRDGGVV